MSRGKKLILLVVVLVLAIAGYIIATQIAKNRPEEDPKDGSEVESDPLWTGYGSILDYTEDDISSVTIENDLDKFTIIEIPEKESDPGFYWAIEGHEEWTLDHTEVNNTIEIAYSMFANRVADEDAVVNERNLADFGLDKPASTITVTFKDGVTLAIHVGNRTADGNFYYGMMDGDNAIYTLGRNAGNTASFTAEGLRYINSLDIIKTDGELYYLLIENDTGRNTEITSIGVNDEGDTLAYYNSGTMKLSIGDDFAYDTQLFVAGNIQDTFQAMPDSILPAEQIEDNAEDLDQYGLGETPRHHVVLTYRVEIIESEIEEAIESGIDVDMSRIEKDPLTGQTFFYVTNEYTFGDEYTAEDGTPMVYFRFAGSRDVFGVLKSEVDKFDFDPYIYVRRVMYMNNIDNVESMKVDIGGTVHEFEIKRGEKVEDEEGNVSQDVVFKIDGQLVDDTNFRKLYQAIIGVMSDYEIYGETPEIDKNDYFTIDYVFTDGSTHSLTYYRAGEFYYVTQVNDETWFAFYYMQFQDILDLFDAALNA